jgi:ATP-binding cassette subfamily B protein
MSKPDVTYKKSFSRTEPGVPSAILKYFKQELVRDKRQAIFFISTITLSHLIRFVIIPLLISFVIQALLTGANVTHIFYLIGGIALGSIISVLCNDKGFTAMFKHEEDAHDRLLQRSTTHLMNHSYQFFSDQRVGTLAGDAMGFARSYQTFLDVYFFNTNHLVIGFFASLIVIAFLSPILLVPLVIVTAGMILLNVRNVRKRAPYRNERKARTSRLTGIIADIMGNQILTRVFARESFEAGVIGHERRKIHDVAIKEIAIIERESLYRQTLVYSFQILTLIVAVWLYSTDSVSIAALVFTITYLMRVADSIFGISSIIRQFEQAFLDAAPMMKILQMDHGVRDVPGASKLKVRDGAIDMVDVNFAYSDNSQDAVFRSLDLHIPAGQKVGLAGHSGGGKTTLTKLLLRFADIDSGHILIDDQDIASVTQTSLRSNIAYVPQEPYLFHRSLRDNISYGKPDASDKEIIVAARKAHAMEFIDKLPEGLDTVVGERGVKLSGGQRQRIAIARAILKDAPILILDEATSALDSESEKLIQASLTELMKGRTSIVIAHRLSTIAKLDRILVLDNGQLVEDGTHDELLDHNGTYARLWKHQSGGFIED